MSCVLPGNANLLVCNCVDSSIQLALGRGSRLAYSRSVHLDTGVTAALVPEIEKGLQSLGLKAKELDAVACVTGPGSFTGIRIGLSTILGLTGLRIPCAGLNLLHILAAGAARETKHPEIWVLQYARRGIVAMQGFRRSDCTSLTAPQCLTLEQADTLLCSRKVPFALLGSGLRRNAVFLGHYSAPGTLLPPQLDIASCQILWQEALHQDFLAEPLLPLYLRESDAVENLAGQAARRGLSQKDCEELLRQHQN